jgi:hypothetical protein
MSARLIFNERQQLAAMTFSNLGIVAMRLASLLLFMTRISITTRSRSKPAHL